VIVKKKKTCPGVSKENADVFNQGKAIGSVEIDKGFKNLILGRLRILSRDKRAPKIDPRVLQYFQYIKHHVGLPLVDLLPDIRFPLHGSCSPNATNPKAKIEGGTLTIEQ
jgi:hypothetical protein